MKRQTLDRSTGERTPPAPVPRWSSRTRIGFRFAFLYLGLFAFATQISGSLFLIPNTGFRGFGVLWPMREITLAIGAHLFHVTAPFVFDRNSGETIFFWVQTFWLLIVAGLGTAVWSVLDQRRENYVSLHKWFRVFVR